SPSSAIAATTAPAESAVISSTLSPPSTLASPARGEGWRGVAQRVARRLGGAGTVRPSESEEQVADLLDDLGIPGRRPAGEAPEEGQHEVGRRVREERVATFEV